MIEKCVTHQLQTLSSSALPRFVVFIISYDHCREVSSGRLFLRLITSEFQDEQLKRNESHEMKRA